jgi:transposase-like protein
MSKEKEPASGVPEGARRANEGTPEERRDGRGRWSAKRKFAAVLRLLRGEDLETLSRELGVTAATLSSWRDQFLEGGAANLKAREVDVDDEETQRLKSLVADLSMSNELLREKIHRMEAGRPLLWRRSKP